MKTDKEVLEYLKPYTEKKGNWIKTLVEVNPDLYGKYMKVQVDIKSSWRNIDGTDTRNETIKQYLRKNGFIYVSYDLCYLRPLDRYRVNDKGFELGLFYYKH